MAKFSPDPVAAGPAIQGISGGGFLIDDAVYPYGALLTPETARAWTAPAIEALDVAALGDLFEREPAPEFLLLGTGATLRRPSLVFAKAIDTRGLGLEVMDSRAAARAWGVLRAESREVVCALMPLGR